MFYNEQLHITYTIAPDLIEYSRKNFKDMTRNEFISELILLDAT